MGDPHEELERLGESRKRLVVAADADRRAIERQLHDGVQQHLVALAVNLQLASQAFDSDPAEAKTLLEQMKRDVQQALGEAMQLAQQIYPPLLDSGGLGTALRAAAASAGVRMSLDIPAKASYPPEVAAAVYFCCVAALETAVGQATVRVQDAEGSIEFAVVTDGLGPEASVLRDRIEALGGQLAVRGNEVSGSLPV